MTTTRTPETGPLRTCIGCRRVRPATELVRVRMVDGQLETGSGPGRGAWVGRSKHCVDLATQRQAWSRALRAEVNAGEIARLCASWSTEPLACPHTNG